MATLLIRNLDDAAYERLKADAKANHRSIVAEAKMRLSAPAPNSAVAAERALRWAKFRETTRQIKPKRGVKVQDIGDFVREMREER